jgi:LssY C-terminus
MLGVLLILYLTFKISRLFSPSDSTAYFVLRSSLLLLVAAFCFPPHAAANCENVAAGKSFWIRLLDPVASYSSKPGTTVRAVLIQSPDCDSNAVFPAGLEVDGEVTYVRKVGLGFIHETARLEIRFDRLVTGAGETLPLAADVVEIDNARETAHKGIIHGINPTNCPQGRITSGLIHLPTFNPYGDLGLIIYRTLTILPEPEIYLPPGTDLRLRLNVPLYVGDQPELPRVSFQMDEYERGDVEMVVQNVPERTTTTKGKDADVVNILFVGSRDEIDEAFDAAGWLPADRTSPQSVSKQLKAFLTLSNYPTMPMSRQLLGGRPQDLTWQKSFNSYGKREHVRLWSQPLTVQGQTAWLSAYTRETSAALSVTNHNFIHHIDRNLDDGVNMLVRDLSLTGCVESVHQLPRPQLNETLVNSTGDEMRTDGTLTVVNLKHCNRPVVEYSHSNPLIPIHPRSRLVRFFRTQVLLYKSDVVRGNIIYSAFDLSYRSIHAFRHRHNDGADDDLDELPMSPVSPATLFPQITLSGD